MKNYQCNFKIMLIISYFFIFKIDVKKKFFFHP